jgi:hypothetical protein
MRRRRLVTRRERASWEFAARTALLLDPRVAAAIATAQGTHGGGRQDDERDHAASDAGGAATDRLLPIATGM